MKCEICKKRESVVHVQQIIGNEKVELHLCEVCAHEKGISTRDDRIELSLSQLLAGILEAAGPENAVEASCPVCGTGADSLRHDAKLGCPECYNHFGDEIRAIHKKLSGSVRHKGKIPKKLLAYKTLLIDKEKLRSKLEEAVKKEDYEQAAALRDQIRAIESNEEPSGD